MSWSVLRPLIVAGDGYFSRSDALRAGVHPRWLRRQCVKGELETIHPGVLAIPGSSRELEYRFRAALMQAGTDALLSHTSALEVYGLLDGADHETVHVSVPRFERSVEGVAMHRAVAREQNRAFGLPVVSVKDAIVGCVGLLGDRDLRFPAIQAVRSGLITPSALADPHGVPLHARSVMREIGEEALAGAESGAEANCFRLFKNSRLPTPQLQVPLQTHRGLKRLDGFWERYRVAYEVDGRQYHTRVADFERQPRRRNAIHAVGVLVLEFTANQVMTEEEQVVADAEATLVARAAERGLPLPWLGRGVRK